MYCEYCGSGPACVVCGRGTPGPGADADDGTDAVAVMAWEDDGGTAADE